MKLFRTLAFLALASCAGFVRADIVDTLTLVSGSGIDDGHFGVGPLQGTLTIGNNAPVNLTIFCVDFNHEVNFGQTWDVSVTPVHQLMGIYGPPNTPGGISAENFYRQEVVLTYTMFLGVSNNQTLIDIQHAVWNMSKPGSFTDAGAVAWNQYAIAHEHDSIFNTAFHDATLISQVVTGHGNDINIGPGQEMITFNQVPEPTTVATVGVAFLSLLGIQLIRRRNNRIQI